MGKYKYKFNSRFFVSNYKIKMHKLVLHVKIQHTKGNICGAFGKKHIQIQVEHLKIHMQMQIQWSVRKYKCKYSWIV